MNDHLATFLIVLLAAVGVLSLRRVWRKLREQDATIKEIQGFNQVERESILAMTYRITQLENEQKD